MDKKNGPRRIFNLLKPYIGPETAWDKVYDWIVTRARFVVIAVEVMVLATFFVKVFVDIQAGTLNQRIGDNKGPFQRLEVGVYPAAFQIQQKSLSYTQLWTNANAYSQVMQEIVSYLPNPGVDVSIRLSDKSVQITGNMELVQISDIETKMKASSTFTGVKLSVSTDANVPGEEAGQYSISAELKNLPKRTLE